MTIVEDGLHYLDNLVARRVLDIEYSRYGELPSIDTSLWLPEQEGVEKMLASIDHYIHSPIITDPLRHSRRKEWRAQLMERSPAALKVLNESALVGNSIVDVYMSITDLPASYSGSHRKNLILAQQMMDFDLPKYRRKRTDEKVSYVRDLWDRLHEFWQIMASDTYDPEVARYLLS